MFRNMTVMSAATRIKYSNVYVVFATNNHNLLRCGKEAMHDGKLPLSRLPSIFSTCNDVQLQVWIGSGPDRKLLLTLNRTIVTSNEQKGWRRIIQQHTRL